MPKLFKNLINLARLFYSSRLSALISEQLFGQHFVVDDRESIRLFLFKFDLPKGNRNNVEAAISGSHRSRQDQDWKNNDDVDDNDEKGRCRLRLWLKFLQLIQHQFPPLLYNFIFLAAFVLAFYVIPRILVSIFFEESHSPHYDAEVDGVGLLLLFIILLKLAVLITWILLAYAVFLAFPVLLLLLIDLALRLFAIVRYHNFLLLDKDQQQQWHTMRGGRSITRSHTFGNEKELSKTTTKWFPAGTILDDSLHQFYRKVTTIRQGTTVSSAHANRRRRHST